MSGGCRRTVSFPVVSVACGYCGVVFDLGRSKYGAYYSGQEFFYCSDGCKSGNSLKKRVERFNGVGGLTNSEKRVARAERVAVRVGELAAWRVENADFIAGERSKIRRSRVYPVDTRVDDMVRLRLGGSSLQFIGDKYGISRERVRQILKKCGCDFIPVKAKKERVLNLVCVKCGSSFNGSRRVKYCSDVCRDVHSSRNRFIDLVCCGCGCEFKRSQYRANIINHRKASLGLDLDVVYCSLGCYHKNGHGKLGDKVDG